MYDLKFHTIIQASGSIFVSSKNNKNISVSNTKYAKHSTKSYKYLVSIHTIVSF